MRVEMSNRVIIVQYFAGVIDELLDYIDAGKFGSERYQPDDIRFMSEVKTKLDAFSERLTPALKEMYIKKYTQRIPFGQFYNVVAPTNQIMALTNELNSIVKKIERPNRD